MLIANGQKQKKNELNFRRKYNNRQRFNWRW